MNLTPSYYGLSSRAKLEEIAPKHLGLVKLIKSRIIQKDALKIIETVRLIQAKEPSSKVSLICYDNICSKSIKTLNENEIDVIFKE